MSRRNGSMDHPEERFERIEATLAEITNIKRQQARVLHARSKLLAEHDKRMDRIGGRLQALKRL
jgi:hypothetical protein